MECPCIAQFRPVNGFPEPVTGDQTSLGKRPLQPPDGVYPGTSRPERIAVKKHSLRRAGLAQIVGYPHRPSKLSCDCPQSLEVEPGRSRHHDDVLRHVVLLPARRMPGDSGERASSGDGIAWLDAESYSMVHRHLRVAARPIAGLQDGDALVLALTRAGSGGPAVSTIRHNRRP
jgi:hypothetical protein